ncbi:hypothetical protein O3P69_012819 [Scylla paramamosain]|uniref:Uncharacterized protein n=1 Tax=Scylla paramamosain TaxID=85552 RepID=A0AAW0TRA0_SCYPA
MVLTLEHARHISAVHVAAVESLEGETGEGELPAGDAVGGVWVTGASYPPDPYSFTALFKLVRSLCQSLEEEEVGLLARVAAPPGTLTPYVVVLPAPHCSALSLVHVAPSDLMLPERHCPDPHQPLPDKLAQEVSDWLSSLPLTDLRHEDLTCPLSHALAAHFHAHTRPAARPLQTSWGRVRCAIRFPLPRATRGMF